MKTYILTMRVETDDDVTADQIREELYEAARDVPFSFEVTDTTEQ